MSNKNKVFSVENAFASSCHEFCIRNQKLKTAQQQQQQQQPSLIPLSGVGYMDQITP